MKIMTVFGTRPEAIKLAPVIHELSRQNIDQSVCVTGQHRQMLDQMLNFFDIHPDVDLDLMKSNQSLADIGLGILGGFGEHLKKIRPTGIIVQGDTSTTFFAALSAFYEKIPVYHVEAGLRTDNMYDPFPEEINRRLVTQLATLNFAPTERAVSNLIKSGVKDEQVFLTGNTVVDALLWAEKKVDNPINTALQGINQNSKTILLTTHRRENLDTGMDNIFKSVVRLVENNPDIQIVFPVHLNPLVAQKAKSYFDHIGDNRVILTEPLSYPDLILVMKNAYLVMTDSGGIQEEAPALGKPVVVLRNTTERPEGVEAGTAVLAGTNEKEIYDITNKLINDKVAYEKMANAVNPYGSGNSAEQIVGYIVDDQSNK